MSVENKSNPSQSGAKVSPTSINLNGGAAMEFDGSEINDTCQSAAAPDSGKNITNEHSIVCGIDIGADSSVVTSFDLGTFKVDIARNDLSNQRTPMIVSFACGHRSFGEVALQLKSTNQNITFDSLVRRIDFMHRSPDEQAKMNWLVKPNSVETVRSGILDVNEKSVSLRTEELLSAVISQLEKFAGGENNRGFPVCIVVPECFGPKHCQAVRDAATLAGVNLKLIVTRSEATVMEYGSKRTVDVLDGNVLMVVDIGHAYTSAAVYSWEGKKATQIAVGCIEGVGGEAVELAIYNDICNEIKEKKCLDIIPGSKASLRVMTQIRKLKETLSAVPDGVLVIESLIEDQDIHFLYSRDRLERCCVPIAERLTDFVRCVLEQVTDDKIRTKINFCELIGGGMRVPFVKEAITQGLGDTGASLSYTMDSMAAPAIGSAFCCAQFLRSKSGVISHPFYDTLPDLHVSEDILKSSIGQPREFLLLSPEERSSSSLMSCEELQLAQERENYLSNVDESFKVLHNTKNKLESKVFEARALAENNGEHSSTIDKEACRAVANRMEEWLLDWEDGGGSSLKTTTETFKLKLDELEKEIIAACGEYIERLKQEKQKKEAEMEEISKAEAIAKAASGTSEEDYDNRRLRKADRMRKVEINRKEATLLFKDGNIDAALERYLRALQHCEKLSLCPDLEEADTEWRKDLLISLQLNIAQANLKLEKFREAGKWATKVLGVDPDSAKALYRLAYAQENLRQFEDAKKNLSRAQKIVPNDKAVAQLLNRVNMQLKREHEKKKRMAQKMFG